MGGIGMHRIVVKVVFALVLVSAIAVPASAAGRADRSGGTAVARVTQRARIVDFAFRPGRIEVDRGTRVRWTNQGNVSHTVTASSFDSGTLAPGDSFSRLFRRAGTFRFHCSIHPDMTGQVVVT